jgi:uncharacterized membrane protein
MPDMMKEQNGNQNPELMKNDPAKWYGPFYFNRKDPRIMVPKINPALGGTFNMANPYALFIVIVIIAAIVTTALTSF